MFLACACSSEDSKLKPPWASAFSTGITGPNARSQTSQMSWAMFLFLAWIVQSLQLLSVVEKEGWQNRVVWCHAGGETPQGMWVITKRYHVGPFREEKENKSVMCDSGPSQRKEQTCRKHPWSIVASAALRSKRISMDIWPCPLLFQYYCYVADSIWKFRFSLPGKHNMIDDTLGIDLVCTGQIAGCLRSPQCNARHHCAQRPFGISC